VQEQLGVQPTGFFGPVTEEAVTAFQRSRGLEPDGEVGPNTWNALFAPAPPFDLGVAALAEARARVGVREQPLGSNRGPEVDRYLAAVGLPPGNFWCAAFAYFCVEEAARKAGKPNPLPKTGSSSALFRWAREQDRLTARPEPGDLFLCIGGSTGHYHTGFVAGDLVEERFPTVEGNSNADGSANGVEVAYRARGRRLPSCHYVRL
jgi:hypothetical protein